MGRGICSFVRAVHAEKGLVQQRGGLLVFCGERLLTIS